MSPDKCATKNIRDISALIGALRKVRVVHHRRIPMASVTLHADGRVEVTEPPTREEIAQADAGLRRVAAALMGMAIEQLEREHREGAAETRAAAQGEANSGGV